MTPVAIPVAIAAAVTSTLASTVTPATLLAALAPAATCFILAPLALVAPALSGTFPTLACAIGTTLGPAPPGGTALWRMSRCSSRHPLSRRAPFALRRSLPVRPLAGVLAAAATPPAPPLARLLSAIGAMPARPPDLDFLLGGLRCR